jgi:hypothetical protein
MTRQIFIVDAHIVDANGTFHYLDGYPKTYDSKNYGGDIDKTQRRAIGDASEVFGAMCKQDSRQLQAVIVSTADGFVVKKEVIGKLADVE